MIDERERYERAFRQFQMPEPAWDRLVRRRDRKRRTQRIAAGVVGIAVFVAAVWIVTSGGWFDRTQTPAAEESTPPVSATPSPGTEPIETLTKYDVGLRLREMDKQCFGSAGCNVTVKVHLEWYRSFGPPPRGAWAWDITYELTGDESGVTTGTLRLYNNCRKWCRVVAVEGNEQFLSTPSRDTPIKVKVIDVEFRPDVEYRP